MSAIGRVSLIAYMTASWAFGSGFGFTLSFASRGSVSWCDRGRAEVLRERDAAVMVVVGDKSGDLAGGMSFGGHECVRLYECYCETVVSILLGSRHEHETRLHTARVASLRAYPVN